MATVKAYTDLEQSKKLAEILPLESADAHYWCKDGDDLRLGGGFSIDKDLDIPAWSLAALLDVLPLGIETHKQTDGDKIYYYVETYMKCMGKETYLSSERHENLIDACYELILKLHELNLKQKK